ncbi:MAG: S41 family peptidase, partial [Marinicellaceae bacterium]
KVINESKIKEDLKGILTNIAQNYVYLDDKGVDLKCIWDNYQNDIPKIKNKVDTVLFFEYLLNEFYDNHLTLRTNTQSSFRLFAPIYTTLINGKPIITQVWQTQFENLNQDIIGAELLKFNGVEINQIIKNFPTQCNDKSNPETKEWIVNKILSGRYNEPRMLTLKLSNKNEIEFDLDKVNLKEEDSLLNSKVINDIGIIRINNSLGNDNLVTEFDQTLNKLSNTKGLVIDLRNTLSGGDSYEARGIMSRFIQEPKPYQKHAFIAKSQNNPDIERSWVEFVTPRLTSYNKPLVVLVGRWTGSMGEGLAIGFEGMKRAEVVGSEMRRLAGEVYDFGLKHQNFGYKLSTVKLFHINGTIREKYIPTHYVKQTTIDKDEVLEKGIVLINKKSE